jgi:ribosomal protein S18 acetylase RimI-like enzyme
MNRSEVDLAINWAKLEGWNPGKYDAEPFYQTNQGGFFLGELNGEPVGCISTVTYDQHFSFLGFYIVKPAFRGLGLGLKIWQTAMTHLGNDRNIGLDAVMAQRENYQKSGFQTAHYHIRYQGVGGGDLPVGVVELHTIPFAELVAFDRRFFPAERSQFLRDWIDLPESFGLGAIVDRQIVGYGCIRASDTGFRIGPLFADNGQIAREIFQGLLAKIPEVPVFIDIPDINLEALNLVRSHRMQPIFPTARMYTKEVPQLPINGVFGITTLEFG